MLKVLKSGNSVDLTKVTAVFIDMLQTSHIVYIICESLELKILAGKFSTLSFGETEAKQYVTDLTKEINQIKYPSKSDKISISSPKSK